MNKWFRTSIVLILAGIVAVCVGIFFVVSNNKQVARCTESTTGVVVDYNVTEETDSDGDTETTYFPIMTYTVDGEEIESQTNNGLSEKAYEIGEEVDIKYNPDKPEEYIMEGYQGAFGSKIEIAIGAVLILVGLGRIVVPVIKSR